MFRKSAFLVTFSFLSLLIFSYFFFKEKKVNIWFLAGVFFLLFFLFFLKLKIFISSSLDFRLKKEDIEERINLFNAEIKKEEAHLSSVPFQIERLSYLEKITESLVELKELESIYDFLITKLKEIFPEADVYLLYWIDKSRSRLKLVSSFKRARTISIKHKEGDTFDFWALRHTQGLLIEDIYRDFRFNPEEIDSLKTRVINSLVIAPLSLGKEMVGLLRIESKERNKFNFEDLRTLSVIADIAAMIIDRAEIFKKIEELAIKDSTTGLYQRNYFLERFREELHRCAKHNEEVGVIMVDIDFFKKINDTYGHIVGDLVLKKFSRILNEVIGNSGNLICRYGGEEFLSYIVASSPSQTLEIAELLRKRTEEMPVKFRRRTINFTISGGVSCFPQHSRFVEELIDKADRALYEAKRTGRNKICIAT